MRNRDMPAGVEPMDEAIGLTKREAAAIAALQGILADSSFQVPDEVRQELISANEVIAGMAVRAADALFDELEKTE